MKLVTLDYGCGTSASILDYDNGKHAIVVTEDNWKHVLDASDDLLLVGHDFLWFMWNTPEKIKMWKSFPHQVSVWCFERVDAIIKPWREKSHFSISCLRQFVDEIYACDEDDCDKYGYKWLPQWASCKFYERREDKPVYTHVLFSGQAGGPEYHARNKLLSDIANDSALSQFIEITNTSRIMTWEEYIDNMVKYPAVLNPVGILRGLNTRAFEAIYSGRTLLQHTAGTYRRHEELLEDVPSVFFFKDLDELKDKVSLIRGGINDSTSHYKNNDLASRMKLIGEDI